MAIQLSLLNASNKVQYIRKGTLKDLLCIKDNTKNCNWACLGFTEPIEIGENTVINFACGSHSIHISVPTIDFNDER